MSEDNFFNSDTNVSKSTYRTKSKAGDKVLDNYPEKVAVPTFQPRITK